MGDWQENSWNNYSQGEWSNAQVGKDVTTSVTEPVPQPHLILKQEPHQNLEFLKLALHAPKEM
jgi:hypothetical protein